MASKQQLDPSAVISAVSAKATHGVMRGIAQLGNVRKLTSSIHHGVIGAKEFMLAMIVLVVCLAVVCLVYVLARVVHLRGFMLGHSENMEEFMKAFYNDIDTSRKLFKALEVSKTVFDAGDKNLIDLLHCSRTMKYFDSHDDETLDKNFDTYFKYYDIMNSSVDQWFHSEDIGSFDTPSLPGKDYLKNLVRSIDAIRTEVRTSVENADYLPAVQRAVFLCSSLSADDYANSVIPAASDQSARALAGALLASCHAKKIGHTAFQSYLQEFIDVCIGMQLMNLYFHVYFDKIKELHNSRRFSFFNFLIVLVKPYVKSLILDKVVDPWKTLMSAKGRSKDWRAFKTAWDSIGPILTNLPRTLASSDGGEGFKSKEEPEVIEGLGGLISGILMIGKFFSVIMEVANALVKLVTDPLGAVLFIVKLVVGTMIGLVLMILYVMMSIPPFIYGIYAMYFFVFNIVLFAIVSFWYVNLFLLFGLIGVVLWVLDLMLSAFNGFTAPSVIAQLGRCENLPDVWYTRGSFIDDNNYNRAFLCQTPCVSRFKPNGVFCSKIPAEQPSFCPHAQVYRIYKGLKTTPTPFMMGEFRADAKFKMLSQEARKAYIAKYFKNRQRFLTRCSSMNEPYDSLTKNICANCDTVKIPNEKDRDDLKSACKQIYCDGQPGEDFCYKFAHTKQKMEYSTALSTDDVLKRIAKLFVSFIISIIVVLMFLYNA
jgi:hypothetical protein